MEKINTIFDQINSLSVGQIVDLVKKIEDEWGVSSAPVAVTSSSKSTGSDSDTFSAPEKSSYSVVMTSPGDAKIPVIKAINKILGLSLMEAKEKVAKMPSILKENVSKTEAEEMKSSLEESGAVIELK